MTDEAGKGTSPEGGGAGGRVGPPGPECGRPPTGPTRVQILRFFSPLTHALARYSIEASISPEGAHRARF